MSRAKDRRRAKTWLLLWLPVLIATIPSANLSVCLMAIHCWLKQSKLCSHNLTQAQAIFEQIGRKLEVLRKKTTFDATKPTGLLAAR